jgi:sec-independent protein translocase protein TatC
MRIGSKDVQVPVEDDVEMSFLDHLEALRWHIIRTIIVWFALAIMAFVNKSFVFDTLFMGPSRTDFWTFRKLCELSQYLGMGDSLCIKEMGFAIQSLSLSGQFMQHINISLSAAFVLAFPYAAWELWRFFRPALSPKERKMTRGIVLSSTALFLIGTLFGYFVVTPITVQFLGNYRLSDSIPTNPDITDYISNITLTTLSIAIVFELPMVVYFLSLAGIFTPRFMAKYRRYAYLVIIILSAILTPGNDILSLMLVSVPFMILYELSILVSYYVNRRRLKKEENENNIG